MSNKIRRSVSMVIDDSRIFSSSPIMKRKRSMFSRKSKLDKKAHFKSKLSIDSDWSIVSDESRKSVTSLTSLRDHSLTSLRSSKSALGNKLKKVKTTIARKLRRANSKTKITEALPPPPQTIQCRTVYNHILTNNQEYVEEYDLVIWEEDYESKSKLSKLFK